jgi:6,7-dimethyl-8-ribityllumazine synthase
MVLDEDALEAMLNRQKAQSVAAEEKESKQTELTHKTEDFEVYERPGEPATGAGLRGTVVEDDGPAELDEVPSEQAAHEIEGASPTTADDVLPNALHHEPTEEKQPAAEPVTIQTDNDLPKETPAIERPRVWPPLTGSNEASPTVVAQEPAVPAVVAEPEQMAKPITIPDPTPVPTSIPEPAPEPELSPSPVTEAATPDPHTHAHADLEVDGSGVRIAIIQALFNQDITDTMADLAVAKAKKRGAKVTHHITVPGVYDLPLLTAHLLERKDVDCAVVIGVVIEGETGHDELITHTTVRTLQQLSLDVDKPIGLGITGPGITWKQAEARVANGAHAVDAALAQVEALKTL